MKDVKENYYQKFTLKVINILISDFNYIFFLININIIHKNEYFK